MARLTPYIILAVVCGWAGSLWWVHLRAGAAGYDNGVRDCEAAHTEAVHVLNTRVVELVDRAASEAVDRAILQQERQALERRLADERARDYRAHGDTGCISDDGMRRAYSIP